MRSQRPGWPHHYDSYTIPVRHEDGSFCCERYDHDNGWWVTDEVHDVGVQIVSDQAYVSDEAPQQAEAVPPECDVRKIMLNVVPGPDGSGQEVFAKGVADVVNLLTEMGQRIEDLEGAKQAEAVPSDVVRDAEGR